MPFNFSFKSLTLKANDSFLWLNHLTGYLYKSQLAVKGLYHFRKAIFYLPLK